MSAKITRKRVSAAMATAASFSTTVETTKVDGRLRRSTRKRKRNVRSDSKKGEVRSFSQCLSHVFLALVLTISFGVSWTDPDEESDEEDKNAVKKSDEEQFACTICRGPFRNAVETMYVCRRQQRMSG